MTDGSYLLNAAPGSYCLLLDTNNTLSDTTPSEPAGWLRVNPENGIRVFVMSATGTAIPDQDFGLFNGSSVSGRVFNDNGITGGIANDGQMNGMEVGLSGVQLQVTCPSSTALCDTTFTDGSGVYRLWILAGSGGPISLSEINPSGYLSTGAQVTGVPSGTYDRDTDTMAFSPVAGTRYTGVDFGDVQVNRFMPDCVQTALPGNVTFCPHTFQGETAGSVTFSSVETPSPDIIGWRSVIYKVDCSQQIDGIVNLDGAITIGGTGVIIPVATSVVAEETLCLVVKVFVPANAGAGSLNVTAVTAAFDYANAVPSISLTYLVNDIVRVSDVGSGVLNLVKSCSKLPLASCDSAKPGDVLTYTITYTNLGAAAIDGDTGGTPALVINDQNPSYTEFVSGSASCGSSPPELTCTVPTPPLPDGNGQVAVTWELMGSLPSSGSGTVSFQVKVSP